MSYLKKIINAIKIYCRQQPIYYSYYQKLSIEKNTVLIESFHGKEIVGHLFYMMQQLTEKHPELTIYVAATNVKQIKRFLLKRKINNVHVVKHLARDYLRLLASAEYLLNDVTYYSFFTKKSGQKYFNFWHGTPLKTLGKDMDQLTDGANGQRNFYMADKIIISNEFTSQVLASAHGLKGIYQGQMVVGPSPRNGILLNKQKRQEIRGQLNIDHKRVSLYLPTWRGTLSNIADSNQKILTDLRYLSKHLQAEECFFIKLHHLQNDIDLKEFPNIFPIPPEYELYEFLTAVDILITDYSSIMYDFLLTDRKIILYTYDQEEYFSTRGVYDDINRYPFPQVKTANQLLQAIQQSEVNIDYRELKNEFCPYDDLDGAAIICDYLFNQQSHEKIKEIKLADEKETAIVLGGGFWDNGVTAALLNTFDNIDLTKRHYIVMLGQHKLKKEHMFRIRNLPPEIIFYPIPETVNAGVLDRFLYLGYMRFNCFFTPWVQKRVANVVKHDFFRLLGALKIDHLIHYTGYGSRYGELIKNVPDAINTVMFIHNDMFKEYETRKNFNKQIVFSAYKRVDKLAVVHNNLKADLIKAIPEIKDKLYVVNNFLGENRIRHLASADLNGTLMETKMEYGASISSLLSDLQRKEIVVFINIGRYDYQKGHDRLLAAFAAVYEKNANTRLVIVAPHGPLREKTLDAVANSSAKEGIYLLGRMNNPYPLLKSCNAFVLSSYYEGLGLVVYEALAVGTAAITVNLAEVTEYLQNNEAIITSNSVAGIEEGMHRYLVNQDVGNEFDFQVPKQKSQAEFERLFL